MIWNSTTILILLSMQTMAFPRGRVTEKPQTFNSMASKHRKPPTHISEFTDPDTGLNPFLDIEEGQTSAGRNAGEDEISDGASYFDIDLVEGEASNRRWGAPVPTLDKTPAIGRWPGVDYKDESFDFPVVTTKFIIPNSTTTEEPKRTKSEDHQADISLKIEEKDKKETDLGSKSSWIYAASSLVTLATVALLLGACWWKRKLKLSHQPTNVKNNDAKS